MENDGKRVPKQWLRIRIKKKNRRWWHVIFLWGKGCWSQDRSILCGSIDPLILRLNQIDQDWIDRSAWPVFTKIDIIFDCTVGSSSNHLQMKAKTRGYLVSKFHQNPSVESLSSDVKLLTHQHDSSSPIALFNLKCLIFFYKLTKTWNDSILD